MNFKKWIALQETGTGTNAIATFMMPLFTIRREPQEMLGFNGSGKEEPEKKHGKKHKGHKKA